MPTAFILNGNDRIPRDRDMLDLYQGFLEHGYNIKFYTTVDVASYNIVVGPEDVFCGSITGCRMIWQKMSVVAPTIEDYPAELSEYMNRTVRKSTLKHFSQGLRDNELCGDNIEYFIKPIKNKLFTGNVFRDSSEFFAKFGYDEYSMSTEIYVSTPVKFVSEYRVYCHNGHILDMYRYDGDWKIFPDVKIVEEMHKKVNTKMPVSYSIDVGVDDNGNTLLVEVNDGYALGNYGLAPREYAAFLRDRWFEIVKK